VREVVEDKGAASRFATCSWGKNGNEFFRRGSCERGFTEKNPTGEEDPSGYIEGNAKKR